MVGRAGLTTTPTSPRYPSRCRGSLRARWSKWTMMVHLYHHHVPAGRTMITCGISRRFMMVTLPPGRGLIHSILVSIVRVLR
jgi:hypothetical protein